MTAVETKLNESMLPKPTLPTTFPGWILAMAWLVMVVVGLWGVFLRFSQGHLLAGYGSAVPWGLWVALYFHGVGIAGGAFLLGAGGFLLGVRGFRSPFALRMTIVLSVAAIIPALLGVWFDLGHMERAAAIVTRPRFTSMMALNAWMYNAFIVCAVISFVLSLKKESEWLKPVIVLALLFSLLFPSQSGVFFAVVSAKAFWHSELLSLLFLVSAVTAGAAMLMLIVGLAASAGFLPQDDRDNAVIRLRRVLIAGILAYFAFEWAEISVALWGPMSHAAAINLVLSGPGWWLFWIVQLLGAGLVPLLLLGTNTPRNWFIGAGFAAACFLAARLNILIPGQLTGELLPGLQEAFVHPRLTYSYVPTPMEIAVGLFMVAMAMAAFYVGNLLNRHLTLRFAKGEAS